MDDCVNDSSEFQLEGEHKCTKIAALGKGNTFLYVVPIFPVYKAKLQVKFQYTDGEGNIHVFDVFARKCDQMDHSLPAIVRLTYSYENAFIINVSQYLYFLAHALHQFCYYYYCFTVHTYKVNRLVKLQRYCYNKWY